jgi:hypothetical protein
MLPLIAIGGAISAVASVIKGVSWVADQLGSSKAATAAADKAKIAPFEAALAAQAAGQTVPGSGGTAALPANTPAPIGIVPTTHGTDYDTLARMQAGFAAYNHIGEHRANHAGADNKTATNDVKPVTRS